MKTKDGFYKDYKVLDNTYALLAAGGQIKIGNQANELPISNSEMNNGLYAQYARELKPLYEKTFTYSCSDNNQALGYIYFGNVRPTTSSIKEPYWIRFRVTVKTSVEDRQGEYECLWCVSGSTVIYKMFNTFYTSSNYPIYAHSLIYHKDTVNTSNRSLYPAKIGVRVQSAHGPKESRTYTIKIWECFNCSFEFFSSPVTYGDTSNGFNSTYHLQTTANATSYGLQETGDVTDINNIRLYYSRVIANTSGIMQYSLIMQDGNGRWQSFTTSSGISSATSSKTKNPNGFLLGSRIYYYSSSANTISTSTTTNYAPYGSVRAYQENVDFRYSTNVISGSANALESYKPLYIVGTINPTNGLFYLDDIWWTQTEPITEDGKIYIRVCEAIYGTYQGDLVSDGYAYHYKKGTFKRYYKEYDQSNLFIGAASTFENNNTTNENTYIKLFNDSVLQAQYRISGGTGINVISDSSGNINISSTLNLSHTHSVTINGSQKTIPYTGTVDLGSYLPLAGNTTSTPMTGTIYSKDVNALYIWSNNKDIDIWHIDGNSTGWDNHYGFYLRYLGTSSGNSNDLVLYAHNQASTPVEVYRVHQDGQFIFNTTPKVGSYTMAHAGNTTNNNINLSWNTETTIATIAGVAIKVKIPSNPNTDTHWTSNLYLGAKDAKSNAATTNGSTYLKLVENNTIRDTQINIVGSGATTVSSDATGILTISSTDTNTHYTTGFYIGAKDNKEYGSTSNEATYLKLFDDNTLRQQYLIKGTGITTVTSDSSGNIIINTPDTNTHWTSNLRLGAVNTTTDAATTNGNTYLKLVENGSVRDRQIKIVGSGSTTVTSNDSGVITISSTDTNTDTKVTQNSVSDNYEYRLLFKNSYNDTNETNIVKYNTNLKYNPSSKILSNDGIIQGTQLKSTVNTGISPLIVNSTTQVQNLYSEYSQKIFPLYEKTYTYTCSADSTSTPASTWQWVFFGNVTPISTVWFEPWEIHYTLELTTSNNQTANNDATKYCQGTYDVFVSFTGTTLVYSIYNRFYSGSYRPLYNHIVLYHDTQAKYNNRNTYPCKIGARIQSSYSPTWERTYKVKVWKLTNCTFSFPNSIELRKDVFPNTTNYNIAEMNGTSTGLRETGDDNDITSTYLTYTTLSVGGSTSTYNIQQYSLIMQDKDGKWQSFTTDQGVANTKTKNSTGFRLGSKIYYVNRSSHAQGGQYLGTSQVMIHVARVDFRYSTNCGTTLVAHKPLYIVGHIGKPENSEDPGLFYLDNTWWTQDIPETEDGKLYILVCDAAYDTYTGDLISDGDAYCFKDGVFQRYGNSNSMLYIGDESTPRDYSTTNENTYLKLFNGNTLNKQFKIYGGSNIQVQSDGSGNINISSTLNLSHTHSVTINGSQKTIPYTGTIDLGNYLPIAGGTMEGAIKRYYGSASSDPMIALTSNNQDIWLWRINHGTSASVAASASTGFGLKYIGTGTDNNNDLILYSDNIHSTQKEVWRVKQDGQFIFNTTPKVGTYNIAHAGNVTNNTITIGWNTETTIATIAGVAIKVKIPTNPNTDTHWTSNLYLGAKDAKSNAATTNGSTYLKLVENNTIRDTQINIVGSGATTVSSDATGILTISSTDTNTHYTTGFYIGAKDNKGYGSTSNEATYLKLFDDNTLRQQYLIKGTGITTVISDGSGNIIINTPDTNTDTHWTSNLRLGAVNTTTDAATTNGNTYLKLVENGSVRDRQIKIVGSGSTTVTSNDSGVITISSTDTNTDTKVTQNSISDNYEYRLLFKNSYNDTNETNIVKYNTNLKYNPYTKLLSNTGGIIQGTQLKSTIPDGAAPLIVTSQTQVQNLYAEYSQKIFPLYEKTFTYSCTDDNQNKAYIYFGNIKPSSDSIKEPYWIRFRLTVKTSVANRQGEYECLWCVSGDTIIYKMYNTFYTGSNYPIYSHSIIYHRLSKKTGGTVLTNADRIQYPSKIGVRVQSAHGATEARTYIIKIWECFNCSFEFFSSPVTYDDSVNGFNSEYHLQTTANATSYGLQETGDVNDYSSIYLTYSTLLVGGDTTHNHVMQYSLIMQDSTGAWQSLTTDTGSGDYQGIGTSKSRNTTGFRLGSKVYYVNRGSALKGGLYLGTTQVMAHGALIDFRYSFNCGTTFVAHQPVYIVGHLGKTENSENPNLFYLDTTWWTQTEPTEEDGKIYIRVCEATYDTYRGDLVSDGNAYWFKNGTFKQYGNSNSMIYIGSNSTQEDNSTTNENTFLKLFNGNILNKQFKIYGGTNIEVKSDASGNIQIINTLVDHNDKVSQSEINTSNWRGILLGYNNNASANTGISSSVTQVSYVTNNLTVQPSTGAISSKGRGTFYGLTSVSGDLIFNNTNHIVWNSGSWYQRIFVTDDSNSDTPVFTFQQSSNSGSTWTDLFTIKDNSEVYAGSNLVGHAGNIKYYIGASSSITADGSVTSTSSNGNSIWTVLKAAGQTFAHSFKAGTGIEVSSDSSGNITITNVAPNIDTKVTQTPTTTNANYEILFSYSNNNDLLTEGARKTSTLLYNPSTLLLTNTGNIKGAILEGTQLKSTASTGTAPLIIASTMVVSNLNADMIDGVHLNGIFTAFSGGTIGSDGVNTLTQINHSLTIGGVTKTAGATSNIKLINSLSVSTLSSNNTTNLSAGITVNGQSASKTITDLYARYLDGHPASYFHIHTARSYTSVDAMPSGLDGWYNIFTINDSIYGVVICTIKAYAHSSLTFIVSKGYQTSSTLQILQYNNSGNASYFYVKGVRILSDGKVQALFNKTAGTSTNVSVNINIFSTTGDLRPNATLTLETSELTDSTTPSVLISLTGTHNTITSDLKGNVTGNLTGNASTASKWQTARTLTLTGSVTGSVSFDGSGNISLATTTNHNHDDRYYTETESNNRFVLKAGDTMTGPLTINSSVNSSYNEGIRITRAANNWAGITFGSTGTSGAPTNGWFAATNPSNQFIISPDTSSNTTGLTLNKAGNMLWKNNIVLDTSNTGLYVGGSGDLTANAAQTTNGNVYLTLKAGNSYFKHNIKGGDGISVISDGNGNITFTNTAPNVDEKVKQTPTTTNANYEILFSGTADNTERTEISRKTSSLIYNPSTKLLTNEGDLKLNSSRTWFRDYGSTLNHIPPYSITGLLSFGYPVYTDPEFASGTNSVSAYNNSGGGTVTITREASTEAANSSGYQLKIVTNGTASPGAGGFYQAITARANAVFVQIFRAKIPVGYDVVTASNTMGDQYKDGFITSTAGTGKWEWYARIVHCGSTGSFANGGHVYLTGSNNTSVTWYVCHCSLIDITKQNYNGLRTRYADDATKLLNSRNLKVNLGSSSAQAFNGSADATGIGVTGTLPFANLPSLYWANIPIQSGTDSTKVPTFGSAIASKSNTTEASFQASNSNGKIELLASTNRGLYDRTKTTWVVGTNGTNTWLSQGNVGIGTDSPGYKLTVNGNSMFYNTVNIDSNAMGAKSHINFNRANFNYINVPTGGTLAISVNGSSGADTFLAIDSSSVYPGYHNKTVDLGTTSYRWKNIYSDKGNFTGQITSTVPNGTSPLIITSQTQVQNLYAEYSQKLQPLYEKTYEYTCTANDTNNGFIYFGNVKPTTTYWNEPFWIRYRVTVKIDPSSTTADHKNYRGEYECLVCFNGSSIIYKMFNSYYSGNPIYNHTIMYYNNANKFDNYRDAHPAKIGVRIQSTSYWNIKRVYTIKVWECYNCNFEFPTSIETYQSIYSDTWYAQTQLSASQGLRETADDNDTGTIYLHFTRLKAGTNGIKAYSFIMQDKDGNWQSFHKGRSSNGTGSTEPDKLINNTTGFRLGSNIYYVNRGDLAAGLYMNGDSQTLIHAYNLDLRYTLNINNTADGLPGNLNPYLPVYIIGHLGNTSGEDPNLFYLDNIETDSTKPDRWWTQTEPTSEDGKIYIKIVEAVRYDYANRRCFHGDLLSNGDAYWFKDGIFQRYGNSNSHLYVGPADDKSTNSSTNPYIKLFNSNSLAGQYQIMGGDGITVTNDGNGNITITNSKPNEDTKVTQNVSNSSNTEFRPLLVSGVTNSSSVTPTFTSDTGTVISMARLYAKPSTGDLYLYNPDSGDSPFLYFQRGDFNTSGTYDYRMFATDGNFHIQNNAGGWNTLLFLGYDGGRIGIGITSPTEKLQVAGNIRSYHIYPNASATYNLGSTSLYWNCLYSRNVFSDTTLHLQSGSASSVIIRINGGTELARFSTNGNVGIGTTSPTYKLHVAGNGYFSGILHLLANQYTDSANTGSLNLNNSDIYGVNSIKFADLSDSGAEGMQWYRDATHVDSLWVKNGVIYFTPNREWGTSGTNYTVWHSGNDGASSGLDADTLDGVHLNGIFTAFSGGTLSSSGNLLTQTDHSITIGGVTKSAGASSNVKIINSLSISTLSSTSTTNLTAAITINGQTSSNVTIANLYARYAEKLYNTSSSNPNTCADGQYVRWYSTISQSSGYAGNNYGFPVSNNANGILWLGTHSGPYGGQIGISSNGNIYYRYISNNTFPTTADGGSWKKIIDTGNVSPSLDISGNTVRVTIGGISSSYITVPFATNSTNSTNATNATYVKTVTRSTNADHYLSFVDSDNSSATAEQLYTSAKIKFNPASGDLNLSGDIRIQGNDEYLGTASGSQCHVQYDTTNKCLNFIFD